jgi:predicted RNA binding protein YcfA (HicA-like mRNA interferase family)
MVLTVLFKCPGKPAIMKVRQVISMIERDGWFRVHAKGGHRQYKHPTKSGRVTISGHPNDDVHPRTLSSILRQARLK